MHIIGRIKRFLEKVKTVPERLIMIQEALGRIEQRQITSRNADIRDSEFRVFSQWGEDGIIQHLVNNVNISQKIFIEFGVENYTESNTRFLLTNNHWSGLVIDGGEKNITYIKQDPIYWASNLKAECSFINKDNINDIITRNGIKGEIGLLSVDIDGNDYWVWEAIDCVEPAIVVSEYNSHFGPTAKVTTPYDPTFVRDSAHFSKVYYGASIGALNSLAEKKGYSLVGTNSAGNNVFFVRNDLVGSMKVLTTEEAFQRAQFREFHDEQGQLTFDDFETRLNKIGGLDVFDLDTGSVKKVADTVGTPTNW